MKRLIAAVFIAIFLAPAATLAKIDLSGPLPVPAGSAINLPSNPTELLDKTVKSLPTSKEALEAVGTKLKDSLSSETGHKVRAVLKDIGKAFVWATELMVKGIKLLIEKL